MKAGARIPRQAERASPRVARSNASMGRAIGRKRSTNGHGYCSVPGLHRIN